MENIEVLVLRNEDLTRNSVFKKINDIEIFDFRNGMSKAQKASIVIYIDQFGETLILKNRYGKEGIVKPISFKPTNIFEKFLNYIFKK
jgi:hypothetical protein